MAHEQGALYGLPLYHGRKVKFALMQALEARTIFIQRALVEGSLLGQLDITQIQKQTGKTFQFFWKNRQMIQQVEALEHRSRRLDVLVSDEIIFNFYDQRLPESVLSRGSLQAYLDKNPEHHESLLLSKKDLMRHEASNISDDRYPKKMQMMGTQLDLTYHFEPGSPKDGVTLIVPLALINQVDERKCFWLVPGLCVEKIHVLLKSLPQKLRRHCVPLPEFSKNCVDEWLEKNQFGKGDLIDSLINQIREKTQVVIHRNDFRLENIPFHCMMNYRVMDEHGRQLDLERNLQKLRSQYAVDARAIFQEVGQSVIHKVSSTKGQDSQNTVHPVTTNDQTSSIKIIDWTFGELPEMLEIKKGQQVFYGYPALQDMQTHCELNVFDDPQEARTIHFQGIRRL